MTALILAWSIPGALLTLRLHGAGCWIVAGLLTVAVVVQAVVLRRGAALASASVEVMCLLEKHPNV